MTKIPFDNGKIDFIEARHPGDHNEQFITSSEQRLVSIQFTPEGLSAFDDGELTVRNILEPHALAKEIEVTTVKKIVPIDSDMKSGRTHKVIKYTNFAFVIDKDDTQALLATLESKRVITEPEQHQAFRLLLKDSIRQSPQTAYKHASSHALSVQ